VLCRAHGLSSGLHGQADIEAGRNPGRKRHYLDVIDMDTHKWNGKVTLVPEALEDPLRWQKPRRVFIDSMSDLFHDSVSWRHLNNAFNMMINGAPRHTYMILTKRPERMLEFLNETRWMNRGILEGPTQNVWPGISAENQEWWEKRRDAFFACRAAVSWVSYEPAIGPIVFSDSDLEKLSWIVMGGETGPGARPMQPDWVRSVRDQCQRAGVSFFFKSHGEWLHESQFTNDEQRNAGLSSIRCDAGDSLQFVRIGKKRAGRVLDGRTWDEYPEPSR
jgi:protein gp37